MNKELSSFAARLRRLIVEFQPSISDGQFSELALELFALQFKNNSAYQKICQARRLTPEVVTHWTQIPAVPTAAFKELELTGIPPAERTAVFHSSGTTEQKPSRHYHNAESLAVYEASLCKWFAEHFQFPISNFQLAILTPPPEQAPHSSLVHMLETVRQKLGKASVPASRSPFFGKVESDSAWTLDFEPLLAQLAGNSNLKTQNSKLLLGTAFSFVHLVDYLADHQMHFHLPKDSRVMETGGYKNRSRALPKAELHALITARLGVPRENIICEYGMSELSSQAYDAATQNSKFKTKNMERQFHFPPWARVQIISSETGCEVAEGETGLIRIFDLANVFSVAAIQTEDLGVRRGDGFELIGRAQLAEPRGCSLMTA